MATNEQQRFLRRDATVNIKRIGLKQRPFADVHHYLLRTSWPRFIALFVASYLTLNAFFALLYLLEGGVANARAGSFADHFFFSVHTTMTIGYGSMYPNDLVSNLLVTVESMASLLSFAMITGLVFNKFSLPQARVLFSQCAVISNRDGVPSLMFRMANERTAQVVEAELHVVLASSEKTLEGEAFRRFYSLELARERSAIFALSWTAIHPIVPSSPLFNQTSEMLASKNSELIVSVVGIDETSSQTIHARHSYSVSEILFGRRMVDILGQNPDGTRFVDYTKFHDTLPVP